ncbi:precorrin-3B C(17)-methyltransferase [Cohnella sp. CFH 77786]|uniref:precorrin-3B C(17)-methyltransferase n=1 Tax=Cohnella sp. CFH 77786 TaxID=2662265 RepID=UPI001C609119|nr:precorrin-3B C(17)-methyltransferase [Cohnella sp. CFH 77786]MBW5447614.1 precorrin-3B C(17)-methyltransferase [Cohnella sp. CFH 77786]
MRESRGKLLIIGFGPGSFEHITKRAREALEESDVVIGYNTYVDLIRELLTDQEIVRTGMTEEVSRAQEAVRQAEAGKKVAVISSGDAGVYGMAGLVYEVLMEKGWRQETGVQVEIIPGISAINSAASLLGAPVMHDACTISLSDHLTPWELIAKRVEAAASADFVIALYNPRSGRRTRQIVETQRILLKHRSPDTPVGIVKSAYRDRQNVVLSTLGGMLEHDIGMLTTVIIGNSTTRIYDGLMITPRGYQRKYTLDADVQPLKPHQRLQSEAEPWALKQGDDGADDDDYLWEDSEDGQSEELEERSEWPGGADRSGSAETRERPAASAMKAIHATPFELAAEALRLVERSKGIAGADNAAYAAPLFRQESILEFALSSGLANKQFTARQMLALAEIAGDKGTIEYSPHHHLIVRVPTSEPEALASRLREEGFALAPIGDVVQIKACDFCNMEKGESVPYAETLQRKLGGMKVPKELRIGFNGCGMACYGAVHEDIGIVYRREKFDLFLGGKTVGRNAHAAQPVAEGIEPERLVETIERIVAAYALDGHPNERFHKFFKRVKEIEGYRHRDVPAFVIEDAVCGD